MFGGVRMALFAAVTAAVTDLTPEQFTPSGIPGTWVVKFFSPYCQTCNLYAPVFLEAVSTLEEEGNTVSFGQVNCVEQGDLCSKLEVSGWPAIKVFSDAEFLAETAINRESAQVLVDFVRELPGGKSGGEPLIAPAKIASKPAATLATLATLVSSTQPAVAVQTVEVGPQPEPLAAEPTENSTDAVEIECVPEFTEITQATVPGLWFIKFYSPQCGHCQDYASIWEKIAHAYPTANFGQLDCVANGAYCKQLGVKAWPEVKAFRDGEYIKDFEERQFTWKGTTKWLKKFGLPRVEEDDVDEHGFPKATTSAVAAESVAAAAATATATAVVPVAVETDSPLNIDRPKVIRTQPISVSHAEGTSLQLNAEQFEELVSRSNEPWMVKFFHPQCPHCQAMAPEWDRYAAASKDTMNVAHVNCQTDLDHCLAQDVKSFPTIRFYVGSEAHEFIGNFELQEFQNYDRVQTGAQVLPMDSLSELKATVNGGLKDGVATFVYLFDSSVTTEDWEALAKQAQSLPGLKSVVYHSSSPEIRSAAKLDGVAGSHLVHVGKGPADDEFYYAFPDNNNPKAIRDTEAVLDWVNRVRFAEPIRLDKSQVEHLSKFSAVSYVHIGSEPNFVAEAKQSFEEALKTQKQSQQDLRDQRSALHKTYSDRGLGSVARSVLITPVDAPLVGKRSFSFIHPTDWTQQFGDVVPTPLPEGESKIVAIDWYNNRYIDSIDGKPLTLVSLEEAAALLQQKGGSKFGKKLKAPKHFNPPVKFKPDLNLGQNIKTIEKHHLSLGGVLVFAAVAFVMARPLRRALRLLHRPAKGPIITGKMD